MHPTCPAPSTLCQIQPFHQSSPCPIPSAETSSPIRSIKSTSQTRPNRQCKPPCGTKANKPTLCSETRCTTTHEHSVDANYLLHLRRYRRGCTRLLMPAVTYLESELYPGWTTASAPAVSTRPESAQLFLKSTQNFSMRHGTTTKQFLL